MIGSLLDTILDRTVIASGTWPIPSCRVAPSPTRSATSLILDHLQGPPHRQARSLDPEAHCFELRETAKYKNDPIEVIQKLAGLVRPYLWEIVSAIPGSAYRRYYVYLGAQRGNTLPQIGSMW